MKQDLSEQLDALQVQDMRIFGGLGGEKWGKPTGLPISPWPSRW